MHSIPTPQSAKDQPLTKVRRPGDLLVGSAIRSSAPHTLLTMFELHQVASATLIQETMVRVTLACRLRTCEGYSEHLEDNAFSND